LTVRALADAGEIVEATALRKALVRIVPLLAVGTLLAQLDRVNIGFAALTMNNELDLSVSVFSLAISAFFVGYFLFELPSNIALSRYGGRLWLARIMLTWGLLAGATAFVWSDWSLIALRFLLGAAEAGYTPGLVLFLSFWLPPQHRSRVFSYVMIALPVAVTIGAPLSGLLLSLDGVGGLHGWQWLFLVEGLPTCLVGLLFIKLMRDKPADAEWLTPEERAALTNAAGNGPEPVRKAGFDLASIKNPRTVQLAAVFFSICAINYGCSYFMPLTLQTFGMSPLKIGVALGLCYGCGAIGMLLWGRRSDRLNERRWHVAIPIMTASAGLLVSSLVPIVSIKIAFLGVAIVGLFAVLPVFWVVPLTVLPVGSRPAGIALINMAGTLAGVIVPLVLGRLHAVTDDYLVGNLALAASGAVGAVIAARITEHASDAE
jgi:MFS transporter, ACS family, tartrate transporter